MSDTLADLASWLPSDFLAADDTTHNKPFLYNHRNLHKPTELPYEFASSSSTESESDDDDVAGITRRFTRSVSLQERLKIPNPVEKRGFSGSPESTLNWSVSGPSLVRSSPATPFGRTEVDAWDFIYAAAGEVARMKMRMNNVRNLNDVVVNKPNTLLGAPRPLGPSLSHHHHHHHSHCAIWRSEREEFLRQQQFRQIVAGVANYGAGGGRQMGLPPSAWRPLQVENQRPQQPCNGFAVKPVVGSGGHCGRATTAVKRECAGTGVFLPRSYCNSPPEPKKKPACSPAPLPARVAQSFNKSMDPIIAQAQPNINAGFAPQYEMLIARRNAVMLAQRRSNTHLGMPDKPLVQPEIVLPQEWTY